MSVKLSSSLPDQDRNGLDRIAGRLVRTPDERHLVIAVVNSPSVKVDHTSDGDVYTPTAGVQFLEVVLDRDDINDVLEVLGRIRAERVDGGTLDFDFGVGDPLREAADDLRRSGATVSFHAAGSGRSASDILKYGTGLLTGEGEGDE